MAASAADAPIGRVRRHRGLVLRILSAVALGPLVGGALTEYVSWRAIFFLNLPVAAGAAPCSWARRAPSRSRRRSVSARRS
jgi:MFS family permease